MSELSKRLDAIEARKNAATPGPWARYGNLGHEVFAVNAHEDDLPGYVAEAVAKDRDAEFIANAPSDVAYLLDLARKQQAALDAVRALANEDEWGRVYMDTIREALEGK